jgi:hypothetical protein
MGRNIGFYCTQSDNDALEGFARSLGLHRVSPRIDMDSPALPQDGRYCFLSVVPRSELHPYGQPRVRVSHAKDPMLIFFRAYFRDPYLVMGQLIWSDDSRELAKRTKPCFDELCRWIRKEWERLPEGGFHVGPGAKQLMAAGAQLVNELPGQATFSIEMVREDIGPA